MSFFSTPARVVRIALASIVLLLVVGTIAVGFEAGDGAILIESNVANSLILAAVLHPNDNMTIRPEVWTFFSSSAVDYERYDGEVVLEYDFRIGAGLGVYFNLYDANELIVFIGPHVSYIFLYDRGQNSIIPNDRSNFVLVGHIINAGPLLGATYMMSEQFGITANVKIDASFEYSGVNYESIQYSDYIYTDFEIHSLRGNIGLLFYLK